MKAQGYSAKDERRILDALGRGLLEEFPNPERVGCPPSNVLKGMASHSVPLAQAEKWLDHLGSCSPCYRDFSQFQKAYQLRRKRTLLAIAASILVCASIGGWAFVRWHNKSQTAQTATLDLRNWSAARGVEPNPNLPPLEMARRSSRITILLPLGSAAGAYEIRVATPAGKVVLAASGTAELENGITSLRVTFGRRSLTPGSYVLQVRKTGLEWNSYRLVLR
ncbi:MAG: hypothetical protein WBD87_06095 [Candidatus Acidiferrales bacterium]